MGHKSKTSSPLPLLLGLLALLAPGFAQAQEPAASPTYQKALQEELVYRVNFGRADDIKILLDRGANPDTINEQGWPAVAIAADRNDAEGEKIVHVLVEAGAHLNVADKTGNYALINVVRNHNIPLVNYLLSKGADFHVTDSQHRTVLDVAKSTGNQDVIALIQQQIDGEAAHKAELLSPANFAKMSRDYGNAACAYQYYIYYLKSTQDPQNDAATQAKADKTRQQMSEISRQLIALFPTTPPSYFTQLAQTAMQGVRDQLDLLVSNRNRRENGVGTDQDEQKRCNAIAEALPTSLSTTKP